MRYISEEKELKKISIYTNIISVKEKLDDFFYKKDSINDTQDERIHIAIIDSTEPFSTKEINNSEVIFDITGGYPVTKQRVYKGIGKESLMKIDLWLEMTTSVFSTEISSEKLDISNYLEELEKFKKIDIKKYVLTEEIIKDLEGYQELEKSKISSKRFIYAVINGYNIFPIKTKKTIIEGMEWKYGIKAFQKTCNYLFQPRDTVLGYIYEITKKI